MEGTYQFFKIEVNELLSPCKLYFKYIGSDIKNNQPNGLLNVFHSKQNPKPDISNNEGSGENPKCIVIPAADNKKFVKDSIYLKLEAMNNIRVRVRAVFPKQDRLEYKAKKDNE